MNYEDARRWPTIPVDQVAREEVETLYSFGHYDGVGTGLIRWQGKLWWAERFATMDDRYWIIALDGPHARRLLARGREWANLFHSGMSWMPDGQRAPEADGPYCTNLPFKYGDEDEYQHRHAFYVEWHKANKLEEPPKTAPVFGYFEDWRM